MRSSALMLSTGSISRAPDPPYGDDVRVLEIFPCIDVRVYCIGGKTSHMPMPFSRIHTRSRSTSHSPLRLALPHEMLVNDDTDLGSFGGDGGALQDSVAYPVRRLGQRTNPA